VEKDNSPLRGFYISEIFGYQFKRYQKKMDFGNVKSLVKNRFKQGLGVRVACHRSHSHRLADDLWIGLRKAFASRCLYNTGKPVFMRAAASRTHSQTRF
jgi:hypothetical protein